MPVDVLPADIALVVKDEASSGELSFSIKKLRESRIIDVRVIAAQASMRNKAINAPWIAEWLLVENNSEVRGYLYLSLSIKNKTLAKKILKKIEKSNLIKREQIYYFAALSICYRSRKYLLYVMSYIYSRSDFISSEASRMCRMLLDDDDNATLKFIELIERDKVIS